ncbi:MAG: AAA family ATPase [Terriglobia bacterium]
MTMRDQVREEVQLYAARSGMTLGEIARQMGYARHSVLQFCSQAKYGDSDGDALASRIREFIAANPPEAPQAPGKLYCTKNVAIIDEQIRNVQRGHWALIYGPPGTQKSFVFEYRMAEAFRESLEPRVVYLYAHQDMAPLALLREVGLGVGAYLSNSRHQMIRSILRVLRRRKSPLALIIDEAQHLAKRLDTLEVLRELGDRGRIGLLVAGHDNVEDLFRPQRGGYLEQWRSRIEQHRRRLPGLSETEAREILAAECGQLSERTVRFFIDGSNVQDERGKSTYLSARRLFNSIRDFKEQRAKAS